MCNRLQFTRAFTFENKGVYGHHGIPRHTSNMRQIGYQGRVMSLPGRDRLLTAKDWTTVVAL